MERTRKDVLDGGRGGVGLGYHQEPVITLGRHTDRGQVVALKKHKMQALGFIISIEAGERLIMGPDN